MKVSIKITSNDGEVAFFTDMDSGTTGNIERVNSAATRDEFLTDLAVGTVLEVNRETADSERDFRKKFRAGVNQCKKT
jgi:mannose/fructose-specific phosphotransferase system component IIA